MNGRGGGDKNWYANVKEWLDKLEMRSKEEELMEINKSEWKKEAKEKLGQVVAEEVEMKIREMTKLRFIREHKTQEYINCCRMEEVKNIMRTRLNMINVRANFKGKGNDLLCVACKEEIETTEHVIQCAEYKRLTGHLIEVENTVDESMQSLKWVREASKVYERIEETRKWLC